MSLIEPISAGPRKRLARADEHIAKLHLELEPYMKRLARAHIRMEKRIESRETRVLVATWTLVDFEPSPTIWPLLISDAFHNLRSALDNAVWWATREVHSSMKVTEMRRIVYPITLTSEKFERHPAVLALREPHRSAVAAQQPFVVTPGDPPRDALWALQQLSNVDKHRELTIPVAIMREGRLQTEPPTNGGELTAPTPNGLSRGDVIAQFVVPWSGAVDQLRLDLECALEALIEGDDDRGAVPLQLGVNEMRNRVEAALDALGL